jgi:hypothetical protein
VLKVSRRWDHIRYVTCLLLGVTADNGSKLERATKQRLLRKAVSLMGMEELAAALSVPVNLLDAWITGKASMPDEKLSVLADLLETFGRPEKG